jgi:uncharacterized protein (DUF427 family)
MDPAPAQTIDASRHPRSIVPAGHVEPVPRRVRGMLGGEVVLDTTRAIYFWEKPFYPEYRFPVEDVGTELLERLGAAARVHGESSEEGPAGTVQIEWGALDAWFEEDEKVAVHPRSPYARVDALRSTRSVRIELRGVLLAESPAPVMVFETGLPTRYYLDRSTVDFEHLIPTETVTGCPYKGWTGQYWSVEVDGKVHPDLAWSYEFPSRELQPIAGLVAFYDERVDVSIDGVPVARRQTPISG